MQFLQMIRSFFVANGDYKAMYLEAASKLHTVEQLLIMSDHQRDMLLEEIQNFETIVEQYKNKLRNANKTIRGN